jgi:hypothetical protein
VWALFWEPQWDCCYASVNIQTEATPTDKLLSMSDLAEMVDKALPKPGKRGPYEKRAA